MHHLSFTTVMALLAAALASGMASPVPEPTIDFDILGDGFNMKVVKLADGQPVPEREPELDWEQAAKKTCSNGKVAVNRVSDMIRLIKLINQDEARCSHRYMAAIYELEPILLRPKERLCEDSTFELMKRYHFRFIQPFKHSNRRPTQFEPMPRDLVKEQLHAEPRKYTVEFDEYDQVLSAPISIRHFFLKFALQVSHQCKMDLIKNLERDEGRVLRQGDLEMMEPFTRRLLGDGEERVDFDSALYIPELDGRLERENGEEFHEPGRQQHLRTSANQDSGLFQTIDACKSRFKPLYDKLFMPIVRLSKLGYDYQGAQGWSEEQRRFLEGDLVQNWLVIMHVCEIFKNTKLIRMDPEAEAELERERQAALARDSLRDVLDAIDNEPDHDEHDDHHNEHSDQPGREAKPEAEGAPLATSEESKVADAADLGSRDGTLSEVGAEEASVLESGPELARPVAYAPSEHFQMDDKLMIDTERDLELQLSLKEGHKNPFGFLGWIRRLKNCLKWALSKLDLERFAHYRRNSLWYSGVLNFFSSVSNVAAITVSVYGLASG